MCNLSTSAALTSKPLLPSGRRRRKGEEQRGWEGGKEGSHLSIDSRKEEKKEEKGDLKRSLGSSAPELNGK